MVLRNVATNYTFEQQRQEINLLADDVNTIDGEITTLQSNVSSLQSLQGTETTDSPTFNNLTLTGYIAGPASMTIDPAAVGDNTGTLVIAGNLQVDGVTTTVNSETLTVSDKNITLASNATSNSTANGAGLTVAGANATLTYDGTIDRWEFNKTLYTNQLQVGPVHITNNAATALVVNDGTNEKFVVDSVNGKINVGSSAGGASGLYIFNSNFSPTAITLDGTSGSITAQGSIFCLNVEPSNNIQLLDDKKLLCGSSTDLQIFHDSSNNHSRIKNTAGQLWLQSDNGIRFTDADINQSMAAFYDNGAVELYYNGTKKFETHSNGVMTSGRLFINSTNAGFDYNTIADTFEILTTNGSVHSEFTSGAFYPATGNSKDLGINIKRWKNAYVSNAIYLNDRIIWGSYPSNQEPTGVNEGDQYYNTTDSKMKIYDGSNWIDFGSGSSSVTTTISKASSHDIWCEGDGMKQSCSGTHRTGVSHSSSTTVTMTFTFSVGVGSITEFKMGLATPNNTNINYAFNNGSFASTGHSGSSCTEIDLTSVAQNAGTVTTFQLQAGGGSGNTHIYMSYWKINGTYIVGSFEDNSQQLTVTI